MKQRMFGRTGRMVSEVGFGSWGIGGGQWTEIPTGKPWRR
jgi:aryl-alcohol dehydrogenase-like predicted oxidoreductase